MEPAEAQTWADPEALGHLAETLIRNAIQATPPGGRIQVGSSRQGNELRWWFSDSGTGIGPAEADHLFDPFFCGRQAGRGLGLGLPRAARTWPWRAGDSTGRPRTGQGSVFQVHLPLTIRPSHVATGLRLRRAAPATAAKLSR